MRRNVLVICLVFVAAICVWQQIKLSKAEGSLPLFLVWGFSVEGFPISKNALDQLEKETKITSQMIQFYLQWPSQKEVASEKDSFAMLANTFKAIAAAGAVPCLTWEPMFIVDGKERTIPFKDILNGHYDGYLSRVAQEIKGWKKYLIIRFAHEMNLKRYHWGTTEEEFGKNSPENYIKMFRYVVDLFKNKHVDNVLWAFCPNTESDPSLPWNQAKFYYPGDEYVDILGMDGYNWAITEEIAKTKNLSWTKPWLSFEHIFQELYQQLKEISSEKPIFVFETATVNRKGRSKTLWLKEALQTAKEWRLMGVIWFQSKKEEDWRIQYQDDSYVPLIREATSPFHDWLELTKERSLSQLHH